MVDATSLTGGRGMGGFGGLASGLDTQAMMNAMLRAERAPIERMEQRKAEHKETDEAWSQVASKLSGLRDATEPLSGDDAFDDFVQATSSDEDVATARATGPDASGSHRFDVTQLAASHQLALHQDDMSGDDSVGEGTFAVDFPHLDDEDATRSIDVDDQDTTLRELASRITDELDGVSAQVVEDHESAWLLLEGTETGADQTFTITDTPAGLADGDEAQELREAQDAELSFGEGVEITRSSNQIDDLLEDTTIELHSEGEVEVSAGRDTDAAVEASVSFADRIVETLGTLDELSRVEQLADDDGDDEDEVLAGPLQGDPAIRQIADGLRRTLTEPREVDGEVITADDMGIEVRGLREVSIDEDALREAFETDFERAAGFFAGAADDADDQDATSELASQQGLAEAIGQRLDTFENSDHGVGGAPSGLIDRARQGIERDIDAIDLRIESHQRRLESREQTLRRQFTAMETQMAELMDMQARMQSQLG